MIDDRDEGWISLVGDWGRDNVEVCACSFSDPGRRFPVASPGELDAAYRAAEEYVISRGWRVVK